MDKWEYNAFTVGVDGTDVIHHMNLEGTQGWEAFTVTYGDDVVGPYITVWLKRKVVDFKYAAPIRHPGLQPPVPWPAAQGLEENANQAPSV